jgi:2,3,4,5-tetrahydropyridine-2-carboxylate N-succinyltransferase
MSFSDIASLITAAYDDRKLLQEEKYSNAVHSAIAALDAGQIRVAEKRDGDWHVNEWVKKSVLLYFAVAQMREHALPPFEFYDKIPLKKNFAKQGIRVVPPGVIRYGSFMAPGTVLMPGYVNIGAYVDSGTMVDTHATVGSCAQVGKNVHVAGAARIGGVLEPPQGKPVVIEDNVFLGSQVSVMEGVIVREEAVLGSGVFLTGSTKIIDVSQSQAKEFRGEVPARSVVIPGSYMRKFPAGEYPVQCALIVGQRKPSTDKKTSLNSVLREFGISSG